MLLNKAIYKYVGTYIKNNVSIVVYRVLEHLVQSLLSSSGLDSDAYYVHGCYYYKLPQHTARLHYMHLF